MGDMTRRFSRFKSSFGAQRQASGRITRILKAQILCSLVFFFTPVGALVGTTTLGMLGGPYAHSVRFHSISVTEPER